MFNNVVIANLPIDERRAPMNPNIPRYISDATGTTPDDLQMFLNNQVAMPVWDVVAGLSGGALPEAGNPDRLPKINEMTEEFDARKGKARHEAGVTPAATRIIEAHGHDVVAATLYPRMAEVGVIGTTSVITQPDLVAVYAGVKHSNIIRTLQAERFDTDIALMGSNRKLQYEKRGTGDDIQRIQTERPLAALYDAEAAETAATEFNILQAIAKSRFPERELIEASDNMEAYELPNGRRLFLMNAPATGDRLAGNKPANTEDSLRFLNSELGGQYKSFAGVTGDMFRWYQHIAAARLLTRFGVVQTIGATPEHGVALMKEAGMIEKARELGISVEAVRRDVGIYLRDAVLPAARKLKYLDQALKSGN